MSAGASPSRLPNITSLRWGGRSRRWMQRKWRKRPVSTATKPLRRLIRNIKGVITTDLSLITFAAEAVSDRAHRLKMFRMRGIGFEVFAEPDDEIIESPGFGVAAVAPYGVQQVAAVDGVPLFLEK